MADAVTTPSGLKYIDEVVGTGDAPTKGKSVKVHYTGRLTDGKKFDSSVDRNDPFVFSIGVGQVIKGWDEGVMSMKVGGKRQLIIPPDLGYGARGAGGAIPDPRTPSLIFDVERPARRRVDPLGDRERGDGVRRTGLKTCPCRELLGVG